MSEGFLEPFSTLRFYDFCNKEVCKTRRINKRSEQFCLIQASLIFLADVEGKMIIDRDADSAALKKNQYLPLSQQTRDWGEKCCFAVVGTQYRVSGTLGRSCTPSPEVRFLVHIVNVFIPLA